MQNINAANWSELPMATDDVVEGTAAEIELNNGGDSKLCFKKLDKSAKAARERGRERKGSQMLDRQLGLMKKFAWVYGKDLANRGCKIFGAQYDRFWGVNELRSYFAIDNAFVLRKLRLLCYPFDHCDWSIGAHLSLDGVHAQPRSNLNALDLYIPSMAYITFIFVANWMQLASYVAVSADGASSHLHRLHVGSMIVRTTTWQIIQLFGYASFLYVYEVHGRLKLIELVALAYYKYVWIVFLLLINLIAGAPICYMLFMYMCLAFGYFLIRTLGDRLYKEPASLVIKLNEESTEPRAPRAPRRNNRLAAQTGSILRMRARNAKLNLFKLSVNTLSKIMPIKSNVRWKNFAKGLRVKLTKEHSRICYYEQRDFQRYQKQRRKRCYFIIIFVLLQFFDVILSLSAGNVLE